MAGPGLAIAGIALSVVSGFVQASNTLAAGRAEQQAARVRQQALEHQADQARQTAGQERAAAQRDAIEQRRQARFLSSRALARAAASGAGAGDPTVENILGGIGAEGEFRALNELFIGEERARNLETQAILKVFEGDQERRAGDVARRASRGTAFAQILGGTASGAAIGFDAFGRKTKKPKNPTLADSGQGLSRYGFG